MVKKAIAVITMCCLLVIAAFPAYSAAALPGVDINTDLLKTMIIAPSNLTAAAEGTTVYLSWQDNSINEIVFDIERKTGSESFTPIATVRTGTVTYTDINVKAGTKYTYRVKAASSTADSPYSNEATVTTGSALITNLPLEPDIDLPLERLTWDYHIESGKAIIDEYRGFGGDVTVPSTLGGAPVTRIDTLAFEFCTEVTGVMVPDSVTSIGMDTFRGCTKLKKVTLPNTITSIGLDCFADCSSLSSINLPAGLTKIEWGTFNSCTSLTAIAIPDNVTSIETDAFFKCTGLTQVTLPKNLTQIAPSTFYGCSKLTALNIAADNTSFAAVDGILYSKDKSTLVIYPSGKLASSVTIADHVKNIGPLVFAGHSSLSSIEFPSGLISIGNRAFEGTGFTSMTIPGTVQTIGTEAFQKCSHLTTVYIPGSVEVVASSAFKACTSLTKVSMVNGTQQINSDAFNGCTALKGIHMPSTIKTIDKGAFQNCPALESIWFYGNPPYIDWDAVDYRDDVKDDVTHHDTDVTLYYPSSLEDAWLYDFNYWGWDIMPFETLQSNLLQLAPNVALKDLILPGMTSGTQPASSAYPGPLPDGSTAIQLSLGKTALGVNGQSFAMDTSPIMLENRLLLPVRYVAEPLGAVAAWNQEEQKVTVTLDGTVIELWIGQNKAKINGVETMIDPNNPNVKPVVVPPGRTMLPLRFLGEALGCEVVWNQDLQQATLTKKK